MKHIFTILVLLLTVESGLAQPYRSTLDLGLHTIRQYNVDTVICYVPFQGYLYGLADRKFHVEYAFYLIWKKGASVYITKAASCLDSLAERSFDSIFSAVLCPEPEIFDEILQNMDQLKNHHLKPNMVRFHNGQRDTIAELNSSHPGYTAISIFSDIFEITNSYSYDQICDCHIRNVDGTIKYEMENINYVFNTSTFVYSMTERLSKLVEAMENTQVFHN